MVGEALAIVTVDMLGAYSRIFASILEPICCPARPDLVATNIEALC
jgi:hypothetical protein